MTTLLPEDTSERVLAAAREVFSEHGFQGATVREICRRAQVNLAAVNYHFSSKEALFAAAVDFKPLTALCIANREGCAKERLQQFIQDFMTQLMDEKRSPQCQLMMRELIEPTLALDKIVHETIAPLHLYLGQLVQDAAGVKISPTDLRRCVFSILGQCLFYRHSHAVIQRLHPKLHYDTKETAATAQHIMEFSLAGLQHIAKNA
ncbi:MAG: CerR family C-terminal domain-containing protein [Gallionellaceae bacterium]|nr:CerR family C-terminal domain-containing protein [Gallionellaceae bacterium]